MQLPSIPDASTKVALIATTDEELGSQTSRDLIKRVSATADAVLVTEASLNGKVKVGRKGTSMYSITVTGRAAHAGLEPEKGINASTEIAHIVTALHALENREHGTTVVPTTMHSGTTTNTVPAVATLDIDSRSFTMAEMERVEQSTSGNHTTPPRGADRSSWWNKSSTVGVNCYSRSLSNP
jgi:glutamate carboxypeptidase